MNKNTLELIEQASTVESAFKVVTNQALTGSPAEKTSALLNGATFVVGLFNDSGSFGNALARGMGVKFGAISTMLSVDALTSSISAYRSAKNETESQQALNGVLKALSSTVSSLGGGAYEYSFGANKAHRCRAMVRWLIS